MDYTSPDDMLGLVAERLGFEPVDLPDLLELTKGLVGTVPYYRPYYVCAIALDTVSHYEKLIKGEGAEFKDPDSTIYGYLKLQAALDQGLGILVPEGMEINLGSSADKVRKRNERLARKNSGITGVRGRW